MKIQYQAQGQVLGGQYARIAYHYMKDQFPEKLEEMEKSGTLTAHLERIQETAETEVMARLAELKGQEPMTKKEKKSFQERSQWHNRLLMMAREEVVKAMVVTLMP